MTIICIFHSNESRYIKVQELVNEGFKNFNLAGNIQKRMKCAARLLDRLGQVSIRYLSSDLSLNVFCNNHKLNFSNKVCAKNTKSSRSLTYFVLLQNVNRKKSKYTQFFYFYKIAFFKEIPGTMQNGCHSKRFHLKYFFSF